jgi:AAA family ATP:ADP antiporter
VARDAEERRLTPASREGQEEPVGGGALQALLRRAVDVKPHEVGAVLMSFVFFFFALSSWFVLRPMRDTVAASIGSTALSTLWIGTLTTMLLANALFSAVVVKLPPRKIIPYAYHAIVATLIVFYFAFLRFGAVEGSASDLLLGKAFYIWTSVFNLFVTSLFWCFMADAFRSDQAKRLFGFIGVGGTLGSIAGSYATASLARSLGSANLLLVSCVLLEVAVLTVMRFPRMAGGTEGTAPASESTALGGSPWAGFRNVMQDRYLLAIAVFLALFTVGSTFVYFQQSEIVRLAFADRTSRTEVLAKIEVAVQVSTVLAQIFLTGRIIKWFGLVAALAFLPVVSMIGFAGLATVPTFTAVALFVIVRRAGNFAFTNPSMEALFTVVAREDKYKAKNFIETFVYRIGDQAGAWIFAGLVAIGIGHPTIAWIAVPISGIWLILAVWLARRHEALARGSGGYGNDRIGSGGSG